MNKRSGARCESPGLRIAAEIEGRGWTQREFAIQMGRPLGFVNELLRGKRSLTVRTAKELEACLSIEARVWLDMEAEYRLLNSPNGAKPVSVTDGISGQRNPLIGPIPRATHGSPDHPLKIGDLQIQCYVLEDGRRVLSMGGMLSALGLSVGTASGEQANRLASFVSTRSLVDFVSEETASKVFTPITFRAPSGGKEAYGYEAPLLADLCEAVLQAKEAGRLHRNQSHVADRASLLVRAFARVGIVALVDEATGYQEDRSRNALEEILRAFISTELLKWAKTFPDEFYRQLFRLRGYKYSEVSSKRPHIIGQLTSDLVYERLAPFVLEELRKTTPRDERGRPKYKYFQRLTEDVGHPKLREHLASVITLMRASDSWNSFMIMMDRALPRYTQLSLQQIEGFLEAEPAIKRHHSA